MLFFQKYKKIFGSLMLALVVGTALITPTQAVLAADPSAEPSGLASYAGPALKVAAVIGTVGVAFLTWPAVAGMGVLGGGLAIGGTLLTAAKVGLSLWAAGEAADFLTGKGVGSVTNLVIYTLALFVKTFASQVLPYIANVFEWGIRMNFTINFTEIPAVVAGWTLIRDLANMLFIFYLLYVAIGMILQLSGINAKSAVTSIVIAALLVNFSMFFTGILIDASNILTGEFYTAITKNGVKLTDITAQATKIAETINPTLQGKEEGIGGVSKSAMNEIILAILFFTIARFFFVGAAVFIGRVISLLFLIMTSPLAVLGTAIPYIKQAEGKWWSTLADQLLLGPFVMFVLWFVLSLAVGTSAITGSAATGGSRTASSQNTGYMYMAATAAAGTPGSGSSGSTSSGAGPSKDDATAAGLGYLQFFLVMGLLNFGITKAKALSGEAGAAVLEFGKQALGVATAVGFGGLAIAGQGTLGAAANRIISNKGKAIDENSWFGKNFSGLSGQINKYSTKAYANKGIREWGLDPAARGTFDVHDAIVPGSKKLLGFEVGLAGGMGGKLFSEMTEGASAGKSFGGSAAATAKTDIETAAAEHRAQIKALRQTATGATEEERKKNGDVAAATYLNSIKNEDEAAQLYKDMPNSERAGLHEAAEELVADSTNPVDRITGRTRTAQEMSDLQTRANAVKSTTEKLLGKQEENEQEIIKRAIDTRAKEGQVKKLKNLLKEAPAGTRTQTDIDSDIDTVMGTMGANERTKIDKDSLKNKKVADWLTAGDLKKLEKSITVTLTPGDKNIIMANMTGPGKRTAKQQASLSTYLGTPDAMQFWDL